MPTGTVKYWSAGRGFGFITSTNGEDTFVHVTEVLRAGEESLRIGQKVRFDIVPNRRGDGRTRAANLEIL